MAEEYVNKLLENDDGLSYDEAETDEESDCQQYQEIPVQLYWIFLWSLEQELASSHYPKITFSLDSIFSAFEIFPNDFKAAANLIIINVTKICNFKACVNKINGSCDNPACFYDHTFDDVVCKFWLTSGCICPEVCPFLHKFPAVSRLASNVNNTFFSTLSCLDCSSLPTLDLTSDSLFPSIISKSKQHRNNDNNDKTKTPVDKPSDSNMKNAEKQIEHNDELLRQDEDNNINSSNKMNQSKKNNKSKNKVVLKLGATSYLSEMAALRQNNNINATEQLLPNTNNDSHYRSSCHDGYTSTQQSTSLYHSDTSNPFLTALGGSLNHRQRDVMSTVLQSEWVTSGRVLSEDYQRHRVQAQVHASNRNKLLQRATAAYVKGSKDLARALSAQGKEENRLMKECHKQAAQDIFLKRNTKGNVMNGILDLHGLHVKEAEECLWALLPALRHLRYVTIVTGAGHHSNGPQRTARLQQAVKNLLEEGGFRYCEKKDKKGFVGAFVVENL